MTSRGRMFAILVLSAIASIAGLTATWAQEVPLPDDQMLPAKLETVENQQYIKLEPKTDPEESGSGLAPETPQDAALSIKPSQPGRSVKLTGGVEEKNLAIEWDDWHNELGQAVASSMFSNFGDALNIPEGLTTWYRCQITADKRVKHAEITKSSGDLWYDSKVLDGVYKLDGSSILAFPPGSQRLELTAEFGIRTGGAKTGYLRFGDVEYHEVTPNSAVEKNEEPERKRKRRGDLDRLNQAKSLSP